MIGQHIVLVCLLSLVTGWSTPDATNECVDGDSCIDIAQCHLFSANLTNGHGQWSAQLKKDARARVCKLPTGAGGTHAYKVCCPVPQKMTLESKRQRALALFDLNACGATVEDRVALGENASLFQYPWMALLRSQGRWTCGGTLINARYVLTAAHCVKGQAISYVRLGEYDLDRAIDCDEWDEECAPAPQNIPVERVIIHEDYSNRHKRNDIALLRLAMPASLNTNVAPICLPVTDALLKFVSQYRLTGWGATEGNELSNILQQARMKLIPNKTCAKWVTKVDRFLRISDTQMCAIGIKKQSGHCKGDSGGPLSTISSSGRYVQLGIVSYGLNSCGEHHVPGMYTRVESFVDWILHNVEP